MDDSKVSIIILNWNGKKDTIECLDSLKRITYPNYEIILVDNGSTDGSVECLKKRYPEVEIIENKKNLGFTEGNNVAIRKVVERGSDCALLLNNDTVVDPDFLTKLVKVLENDISIGIAGPTVYYYNEKYRIQSSGGKICWYKGQTPHLTNEDKIKLNEIKDVDYVMGCALIARCGLFKKIGYLNKNYFAYWEETDLCVRAKKADYRIVNVPAAKIWHKEGSTTEKISGFHEYQMTRNNEYQMTRNMFWFMKSQASSIHYLIFIVYLFGLKFWYISAVYILYHQNLVAYKSFLKGIVDGLRFNKCFNIKQLPYQI